MNKKFSFNFKFLDRFKKKSESNLNDQNHDDEIHPSDVSSKVRFDSQNDLAPEVEFESAEHSEVFAEKTLGGFKPPPMDEISEELSEHPIPEKNQIDPLFSTQTSSTEQLNHAEIINTEKESFDHDGHVETEFNEFGENKNPPSRPVEAKKFNFHFPHFKSNPFDRFKGSNFKDSFQKIEKISWNEIVLKIFSPYSRGKIHNIFLVLFVITFTYLIGKSIALVTNRLTKIDIKPRSTIVIPEERQDPTLSDINKITSANLFNAKEMEEVKPKGPKVDISQIHCVEADRPTGKQLKLVDTIVLQDSVKSVASVQARGGNDLLNLREGETIDGSEISKIQRMKLILKNLETGDCEYLASEKEDESPIPTQIKILPPSAGKALFKSMNPSIKNVGNNFKIKRAYRDEMVTKMSDVLTQAKAIQITNPDGTLCFKMTEIVPGSIYSQLNIQENDIICNVNGRKIDNLNELMGLLGRIKEIDSMQIGLKRNGMQENLDYSFE